MGGESDDKPFDDEPFEAGVEADEDEEPKTFIQQLAGKLGQSLRQYTKDQGGNPDLELEKFAINSVLSATHTAEMDKEDQKDIIKKVKSSGQEDDDKIDVNIDADEEDIDVDVDKGEDEELDFGSQEESTFVETDNSTLEKYYNATVTSKKNGLTGEVVKIKNDDLGVHLKVVVTDGKYKGKHFFATPDEVIVMNPEADEIDQSDLEAASDYFDGLNEARIEITKDMMDMLHKKGKCDCGDHTLVYKNEVNEEDENNPWAICTASVGREDKEKYERCVKDVKKQNESVVKESDTTSLQNDENFHIFVPKSDMKEKIKEALKENFNSRSEEPLTKPKPKTKPETKPLEKPSRRKKPWRVRPNVEPKPKAEEVKEEKVDGYNGKILKTLHLDDDEAILKVNIDNDPVEVKFQNTGEWTVKPMDYDEPWVYTYESVDAPNGKKYQVGVEFFGSPETNLDIAGLHDEYVEEA